jgi:hypothetical protein
MSARLIARSRDLKRLQDEGYELEVRSGYAIVRSVPYITPDAKIAFGVVVTNLVLNDDVTQKPGDHQVWFGGAQPCHADGSPITALGAQPGTQTLCEGVEVHYRFSAKPPEGYPDYYAKIVQYIEILSNPARSIDPRATARTFKPVEASEAESVFLYTDTASSRAGIAAVARKLAMNRIAIIGLGGTGAHILDLLAKTEVREIHLFDGDRFLQHNAFRSPGAASLDDLRAAPSKVAYYAGVYGRMRRGIVPHDEFIDDTNVGTLAGFDFVFVCVDKPSARGVIAAFLHDQRIPFIDVGMELEFLESELCLIGACRTTLSTPEKNDHFARHVSRGGDASDDLYATNIQVADMNALNAALAVMKWKKYCGFYQDLYKEHQSVYAINAHQLTRDETAGP